mmetsp:Transcript_10612/g.20487  ORF Transcript_10612/g.20487 Transcript_10612/m.20487 type:complete len:217 (-) Transcript_10612:2334-2984(-)
MKRKEPHANFIPCFKSPEPSAFSTAVNSRAQSPRSTARKHELTPESLADLSKESLIEIVEGQQTTIEQLEQELAMYKLRETSVLHEIVQETHETDVVPTDLENFEACRHMIMNASCYSESLMSSMQSDDSVQIGLLSLPSCEGLGNETSTQSKKVRRLEKTIAKHEAFILQLKNTLETLLEERKMSRIQHLRSLQEINDLKARLSATLDFRPHKSK